MAKTKSDGQQIRETLDGPKVEHDALISFYAARAHEAGERSSDAGESADKTAKFLDETGLNSQAHRWGGSIVGKLKKKDGQSKAMDIIRSMKVLLPMLENHVAGQGSAEMDLGEPETSDASADDQDGDTNVEDIEIEDDVSGDDETNVVTPINFGGEAG